MIGIQVVTHGLAQRVPSGLLQWAEAAGLRQREDRETHTAVLGETSTQASSSCSGCCGESALRKPLDFVSVWQEQRVSRKSDNSHRIQRATNLSQVQISNLWNALQNVGSWHHRFQSNVSMRGDNADGDRLTNLFWRWLPATRIGSWNPHIARGTARAASATRPARSSGKRRAV